MNLSEFLVSCLDVFECSRFAVIRQQVQLPELDYIFVVSRDISKSGFEVQHFTLEVQVGSIESMAAFINAALADIDIEVIELILID